MIEQVAKALAAADNGAPTTWKLYVDDARAAIKALRKATPQMIQAAADCESSIVEDVYTAMIDAALAEPLAL